MVTIIDYGVGNLFSLESSFRKIGEEVCVSSDPDRIRAAERLLLPGVGAFGDAAARLKESGLYGVIREAAESGKPLLGICLGMQLLFERGYEYGVHEGLGLLRGEVVPMKGYIPDGLKIPAIGWNALKIKKESPLFKYVNSGDHVYFVHSYYAKCGEDSLLATAEYGKDVTAAVGYANIFGCQFHPEKSGEVGLSILRAFAEI